MKEEKNIFKKEVCYRVSKGEFKCEEVTEKETFVELKEKYVIHPLLFRLIELSNKVGRPPLLLGAYGIGKSQIVYAYAIKKWEQLRKQNPNIKLYFYHELTKDEVKEIKKSPSDYYLLVDIKASQYAPDEIKGVLYLDKEGNLVQKPPLWLELLSLDGIHGLLFLDEINTAREEVTVTLYELMLQRKIGETKLSDNVEIVAAGNYSEESVAAQPLPEPLINRLTVINVNKFLKSVDEWIENYAKVVGIPDFIISYLQLFPKFFWGRVDDRNYLPGPSPRQWDAVSRLVINLLKEIEKELPDKDKYYVFYTFLLYMLTTEVDFEAYLENGNSTKVSKTIMDYLIDNSVNLGLSQYPLSFKGISSNKIIIKLASLVSRKLGIPYEKAVSLTKKVIPSIVSIAGLIGNIPSKSFLAYLTEYFKYKYEEKANPEVYLKNPSKFYQDIEPILSGNLQDLSEEERTKLFSKLAGRASIIRDYIVKNPTKMHMFLSFLEDILSKFGDTAAPYINDLILSHLPPLLRSNLLRQIEVHRDKYPNLYKLVELLTL